MSRNIARQTGGKVMARNPQASLDMGVQSMIDIILIAREPASLGIVAVAWRLRGVPCAAY